MDLLYKKWDVKISLKKNGFVAVNVAEPFTFM